MKKRSLLLLPLVTLLISSCTPSPSKTSEYDDVETGELPSDYYDDPEPTPRHYDSPRGESNSEIDNAIDKWFDSLDK